MFNLEIFCKLRNLLFTQGSCIDWTLVQIGRNDLPKIYGVNALTNKQTVSIVSYEEKVATE